MVDLSEWKPEYSVGDSTLDSQHQQLLKLCKRVSEYVCNGTQQSIETFHSFLSRLAFYADIHFKYEEDVLRQVGFPHQEEQVQEHDAYRDWLVEFLTAAIKGNIDKLSLQAYLERWWVSHILDSDMRYRSYLISSR